MVKEESILKFMEIQHGELREALANLGMHLGYREKSMQSKQKSKIINFKKKELKHIALEEQVMFVFNKKIKKVKTFNEIRKQHPEIIKLVDKIEKNILKKEDSLKYIQELQKLLRKHVALEEKTLYSMMDKILTSAEKTKLIEKANNFLN